MAKGRDIEFLYEIGSLRNIPRAWIQHLATDCASTLEHTIRVVFLALLIARKEGVKSEEKIIKMALLHDLAETRTADLAYVHKVYTKADDARAARDLLAGTSLDDFEAIVVEYEKRSSIEAKIVKDADNLDIDLELRELEERGNRVAAKKQPLRKFVRDKKLYTKTAKSMWDEIQKSDPSSWHLATNKWLKIPSAGK
ncbi:MAG: HD domain-containing protein [Candidatus Kaiserbacteria bacterium]|nr:MAG: HD domain-containing protein [Candidatus Kaiserbacteria bacterium]